MKSLILSAVWFALGCIPELVMLADALHPTQAQRDVSDAEVVKLPHNRMWMVEYNRYGFTYPLDQYIFWSEPGVIAHYEPATHIHAVQIKSPWTFSVGYTTYTVYFDHFRFTRTLFDVEARQRKFPNDRPGLIPDP